MADRSSVLLRLASATAHATSGEPLAQRLCRACVQILGAHGAAITFASSRPERVTVWASDGTSADLEDLQDVLGEGPGQEAFDTNRAVVTQIDGGGSGRYPVFTDLAGAAEGCATIWAVPMRAVGRAVGVLTLYRRGGALACSLEDAQLLADAVTAALVNAPEGPVSARAWSDRARIHQATGMLVAHLGLAPDDAMALLRAHAFAEGTTVDAVAEAVVSDAVTFRGPDDGARGGTQ